MPAKAKKPARKQTPRKKFRPQAGKKAPAPLPVPVREKTDPDGLTPKQRRFVQEYLIDLNATAAVRRAGYDTAHPDVIGSQLLGKAKVAAAVSKALAERARRRQITQDDVLEGLYEQATYHSPLDASHAARVKAWELLGRHLGCKFGSDGKLDVNVQGQVNHVHAHLEGVLQLEKLELPVEVLRQLAYAPEKPVEVCNGADQGRERDVRTSVEGHDGLQLGQAAP